MTGDNSRVHLDRDYALSLGFHDNFAHGLLGGSWAAGLLSRERLPGSMEVNFDLPVFVGDTLHLSATRGAGCEFSVRNQRAQVTSRGRLEFVDVAQLDGRAAPPIFEPTDFQADAGKVYYARDIIADGPRGRSSPHRFEAQEVRAFCQFTGQGLQGGEWVPSMLVFCRSFADWLKAFTQVALPDSGSPGHLQDRWLQHRPVYIGDELTTHYRPGGLRLSNSRPGMGLLEIELQTVNQHGELVQHSTVLLMMAASEPRK
ncbi:MAG: hypothetical protein KDI01_00620 [Halioglobus sp.]|nr:hypothetical protein [Halioglobus sp.]